MVLGIGRLSYQKNFELLIDAFHQAQAARPMRLIILGEGDLRDSLTERVKTLDLTDVVDMPGFVDNPYGYMSRADVFAMSSHFEGLPTVLIEALYCGAEVVSVDCPSGPWEILDNGQYGTLVPPGDTAALADAIVGALDAGRPPNPERSWDRYEELHVVGEYLRLCGGVERTQSRVSG